MGYNPSRNVRGFLYICIMDYQKIYNDIMLKARSEKRKKGGNIYYEAHHIVPKCMGGKGTVSQWKKHPNIILLTAKEHFISHKLLHLIYPNNKKIFNALYCFIRKSKHQERNYNISSREYQELKDKKSKYMKENNPMFKQELKNRRSEFMVEFYKDPVNLENAAKRLKVNRSKNPEKYVGHANKNGKLSDYLRVNNPMFREEVKIKFRGENHPNFGIPRTEEQKKNQSDKMKGKMVGDKNPMKNPEVAKKNALARKGKKQPTTTCPHCMIVGSVGNLKRYHFDNCKLK